MAIELERHEVVVPVGEAILVIDLEPPDSEAQKRDAVLMRLQSYGLQRLSERVFMIDSVSAVSPKLLEDLGGLLGAKDVLWMLPTNKPLTMIHAPRDDDEGIRLK